VSESGLKDLFEGGAKLRGELFRPQRRDRQQAKGKTDCQLGSHLLFSFRPADFSAPGFAGQTGARPNLKP
jgi:hypothetical protein